MNKIAHAQAVQAACKKKFGNKTELKCKGAVHYPDSVEREYRRITNTYMTVLNKALAKHLPTIRRAIEAEREGLYQDASSNLYKTIARVFTQIRNEIDKAYTAFDLNRKIQQIANRTQKLGIRQWKNVVHQTLGINLVDDYYKGEFLRNTMELWVDKNVNMIKTIPQNTLDQMQNIVLDGYKNGLPNTKIGRQIQDAYGMERRRAQLLARDQTAKLNADITQAQQRDAGVNEYIWSTAKDERVRPCHADLDGQRCSWDEPPEQWYDTKKKGRVYCGYAHPGEFYLCRCVPKPVFDFLGLDLPWSGIGG